MNDRYDDRPTERGYPPRPYRAHDQADRGYGPSEHTDRGYGPYDDAGQQYAQQYAEDGYTDGYDALPPKPAARRSRVSTIAIPTALVVLAATALAGGASAARFGGFGRNAANTNVAAAAGGAAAGNNGGMTAPRLKGRAAKNAAAKAAAPAAAAAAAAAAVVNPNCTLIVPANPTTAQGLSTPFQLVATNPAAGPCNEGNANQSAFVQGAILTPNGQLTLYDPLVIDKGTQPIVAPTPAQVPAGSTVALWFGFNGTLLTLQSAPGTTSLAQGNCVNGTPGSIFGQFSYCNAPAYFQLAQTLVAQNLLQVPPIGTATDGMPCPTLRDFSLVDQDQSDNVDSHYLLSANGQTGLANAATRAALQQGGQNAPVDLANGSDNRLLDVFVDPTLGCTPWTRPNGSMDGAPSPSLPLNELQAAMFQAAPVALVPLNDPMAMINNAQSVTKDNLYRVGVDQTPIGQAADNGSGTTYCQNLFQNPVGIQRVFKDMNILANGKSPDPAAASNLFTFLAMRGQASFENLGCGALLKIANPIKTTLTNGIVTAATFMLGATAVAPAGTTTTTATTTATPTATQTPTAPAAAPATPAAAPATPAAPPATPVTPPTANTGWSPGHRYHG
jgi:hypothetical protein